MALISPVKQSRTPKQITVVARNASFAEQVFELKLRPGDTVWQLKRRILECFLEAEGLPPDRADITFVAAGLESAPESTLNQVLSLVSAAVEFEALVMCTRTQKMHPFLAFTRAKHGHLFASCDTCRIGRANVNRLQSAERRGMDVITCPWCLTVKVAADFRAGDDQCSQCRLSSARGIGGAAQVAKGEGGRKMQFSSEAEFQAWWASEINSGLRYSLHQDTPGPCVDTRDPSYEPHRPETWVAWEDDGQSSTIMRERRWHCRAKVSKQLPDTALNSVTAGQCSCGIFACTHVNPNTRGPGIVEVHILGEHHSTCHDFGHKLRRKRKHQSNGKEGRAKPKKPLRLTVKEEDVEGDDGSTWPQGSLDLSSETDLSQAVLLQQLLEQQQIILGKQRQEHEDMADITQEQLRQLQLQIKLQQQQIKMQHQMMERQLRIMQTGQGDSDEADEIQRALQPLLLAYPSVAPIPDPLELSAEGQDIMVRWHSLLEEMEIKVGAVERKEMLDKIDGQLQRCRNAAIYETRKSDTPK